MRQRSPTPDVTVVARTTVKDALLRANAPFRAIEAVRMPLLERIYGWSLRRIFKYNFDTQVGNARLFLARDFHMDSGMKYLVECFYRSIRDGAPLPIPYRQILLTATIVDAIFDQLRRQLSAF